MKKGFTLAELLVALGILGVIATFSIPKVITNANNTKYYAMAKETASTISQAYQSYKFENTVNSTFNAALLLPYLNTVKPDNTTVYQDNELNSPFNVNCSNTSNNQCYQLPNGSLINFFPLQNFGALGNDRFIYIDFDPDGSGPAFDVSFMLFYNGRVLSEGDAWGFSSFGSGGFCPLCNPTYWKDWK